MTKKDYELIAQTQRYCLNHCDDDAERAIVEWTSEKHAEFLASTNPRFNRDTFLQACGVVAR